MPGTSDIWREDLIIPSHLPPTGLKGCTLMDLWYTLNVSLAIAGVIDGRVAGHLGAVDGLKTSSIHVCVCPLFGM